MRRIKAHHHQALLAIILMISTSQAQAFNFIRHKNSGAGQAQTQPAQAAASAGSAGSIKAPESTQAPADSPAGQIQSAPPEPPSGRPTGTNSTATSPAAPAGMAQNARTYHQKDFSNTFWYILPNGWGRYQIPYQTHDCLSLRQDSKIVATISFNDLTGKSLDHLKDETADENKKQMEKYQLVENKIITLDNGLTCAQIIGLASIEDQEARLVQCIFPFKKKHFLVATLTVAKPVGEKYDKLLHVVVTSVTTKPNSDKGTR